LSGKDLSGRIGGAGISAFEFGPGTLRLESPFQPRSVCVAKIIAAKSAIPEQLG
jgi:hypothetical protein